MSRRLFVMRLIAFLYLTAAFVELIHAERRDSLVYYAIAVGLGICAWVANERAREENTHG